jgi:hypothetical protein
MIEGLRVTGRHGLRRPDGRVEHRRVVEVLLVVVLRRRVALPLLRHDVHDDRPLAREVDRVGERMLQRLDVVTVDRPDVAHAERLEERRRLQELAHRGLEGLDAALGLGSHHGQVAHEPLEASLAAHVDRVEADRGEAVGQLVGEPIGEGVRLVGLQVGGQVGDRRRIGTAVVVEDDDHPPLRVAEVVERLVRHSAGHRPVADHGHDVASIGSDPAIARDRQPVGVGEHGRGVAVLDEVVLALFARRVAGETAGLAQRLELGPASGDDLVDVGLVPGVPQDGVGRGVEHPVECDGELDRAEVGTEVPTGLGDRLHDEVADLPAQLVELRVGERPQVAWLVDRLERHSGRHATCTGARWLIKRCASGSRRPRVPPRG